MLANRVFDRGARPGRDKFRICSTLVETRGGGYQIWSLGLSSSVDHRAPSSEPPSNALFGLAETRSSVIHLVGRVVSSTSVEMPGNTRPRSGAAV